MSRKTVTALYRSFFGYTLGRDRKRRLLMFSRGDAVVYKCRGLYRVDEIGTPEFLSGSGNKKYYTLQSVEDAGIRRMFRQMTQRISAGRSAAMRRWS